MRLSGPEYYPKSSSLGSSAPVEEVRRAVLAWAEGTGCDLHQQRLPGGAPPYGAGGACSAAISGSLSEPRRATVVPANTRTKPKRVRTVRLS